MGFFWKLLAGMTLVVVATAWVADLRVSRLVQDSRAEALMRRAQDDALVFARLARPLMARGDEAGLELLGDDLALELAGRRVTFIAPDGRVLADSHESPAVMENHGTRPEMLEPGSVHQRVSASIGREMIYVAIAVRGDPPGGASAGGAGAGGAGAGDVGAGAALGPLLGHARVALDVAEVRAEDSALRSEMLVGLAVALTVGLVLALVISHRIAKPMRRITAAIGALGRGDYRPHIEAEGASELRRMAQVVNDVGQRLAERETRIVAEVGQKGAILSAMDEGLVAVDRSERIVLLNEAGRAMLASGGGRVGAPLSDVTPEPELVQAASRCLGSGERCEGEIASFCGEEGRRVAYVATPVIDPAGRAEMAVLMLRDVTALRRLEQMRQDFVANVSHELKTPLTSMRGYVEAVLDDPDMHPARRQAFLGKAGRSTERLTSIVSDLLDLARMERDQSEAIAEPVDLPALVADCVRSVQHDADESRVRLEMQLTGEPMQVMGDDQALVTAVTNLLDNAVKYSPEGGVVQVELGQEQGCASLVVGDQGPGIPEAVQERIFERFFRVDKDRSRQLGGTGLGLSIVRNVVQGHGGEVWVESTLGEGSRFHVRLPLIPPSD